MPSPPDQVVAKGVGRPDAKLGAAHGVDAVTAKHLNNAYASGEIEAGATRARFARVQTEGGVESEAPHKDLVIRLILNLLAEDRP